MLRTYYIILFIFFFSCKNNSDFEKSLPLLNEFVLKVNEDWGGLSIFKSNYDYPYIILDKNSLRGKTPYFLDSQKVLKVDSDLNLLLEDVLLDGILEISCYSKDRIEFITSKKSSIFGQRRTGYLYFKNEGRFSLLDCETEFLYGDWYSFECLRSY